MFREIRVILNPRVYVGTKELGIRKLSKEEAIICQRFVTMKFVVVSKSTCVHTLKRLFDEINSPPKIHVLR